MTLHQPRRSRLAVLIAAVMIMSGLAVAGSAAPASAATQIEGLGVHVDDLALSEDGARAYAVATETDQLSIVDTESELVVGQVTVGRHPRGVVSGETVHGERVYVANYFRNDGSPGTVSVVDPAAQEVVATIPVGVNPDGIAITPDGSTVYVATYNSRTLTEIDTATSTVTREIWIEDRPLAVAVSPDGQRVYVTHESRETDTSVTAVDVATGAIVDAVLTPGTEDYRGDIVAYPYGIAVSPDGSTLYVSDVHAQIISVIDTEPMAMRTTVATGFSPYGVAVTPDGGAVYVANEQQASLTVIDTETLTTRLQPAGSYPIEVEVSPDGDRVYVADYIFGYLTVIAAPVVDALSPTAGGIAGGQPVTIVGDRLEGTTSVRFGSVEASFTVDSDDQITALVPPTAEPGPVEVVLESADGVSRPTTFTYLAPVTITGAASPDVELGGTVHDSVTVSGRGEATGTVDFHLYGPGDTTCVGVPQFSDLQVPLVDGAATSASYVPQVLGELRWVVSYSGDPVHAPTSTGCGDPGQGVTVEQARSTITLSSSANPSRPGDEVIFIAVATGFNDPSGAITFVVDGAPVAEVPLLDGRATFSTSALPAGQHVVEARYPGDAWHLPSSAALTQTVGKIATELEAEPVLRTLPDLVAHLTLDDGTPVVGKTVTFTGRLLLLPVHLCTATTDASGTARCSGGGLVGLLGLGYYTATFTGDATYLPSTARGALL